MRLLLALVALLLVACSPTASNPTPLASESSELDGGAPSGWVDAGPSTKAEEPLPPPADGSAPTSSEGGTPPAKSCSATPLKAGTQTRTLTVGTLKRNYDLYVPKSYTGTTATPVVFFFHPLGTNKYYHQNTGGPPKAEKEGFLAVFAQGVNGSWNAGACCATSNGAAGGQPVDDVGFVRAILAELQTIACVDSKRVYASGFSNGGFLSHKLACEAADLFAAVVPVAAVNGVPSESCKPVRPVPVYMINGTTDLLVPYKGGFSFPLVTQGTFISAQESFEGWAKRNGCSDAASVSFQKGKVTCQTHKQCKGGVEVTLCTVEGGGHCYFGELICFMGTNNSDLKAIDASWDFLKRFTLP
jgi:polyhydroxybutyrate depolymerase